MDPEPVRFTMAGSQDLSPEKLQDLRSTLAERALLPDADLIGASASGATGEDDERSASQPARTRVSSATPSERTPLLPPRLKAMLAADTQEEALQRAAHYIEVAVTEHKVQMKGLTSTARTLFWMRRQWWYLLAVRLVIIALLALVLIEPTSHRDIERDPQHRAAQIAITAIAVVVLTADVVVRFRPFGVSHWKSPWNVLNALAIVVVAIDLLCRLSGVTTWQFSRVVRPLLLIVQSSRLRRTVLLIARSLPSVIGITILFAFVIACFAHLGVTLFKGQYSTAPGALPTGDFNTIIAAMLTLTVTVTTENWPFIAFPALAVSSWSVVYFIVFCLVHIVLSSLLLSNIFDVYGDQHRSHITKRIVKERRNIMLAFHCIDRNGDGVISWDEWDGLMQILRPDLAPEMSRFMFALLDTDGGATLQLDEFAMLPDMLMWQIETVPDRDRWQLISERVTQLFGVPLSRLYALVSHDYFSYGSKAVVLGNALYLWATVDTRGHSCRPLELVLLAAMTAELMAKVAGKGTSAFWQSYMDRWDVVVVLVTWLLFALFSGGLVDKFVNLTPFRILDLYRVRGKYSGTMAQMLAIDSQFDSFIYSLKQTVVMIIAMVTVLLSVMYTYSIVGMELFDGLTAVKYTPPYDEPPANYNSFGHAMFALFQIFLENNWNDQLYFFCSAYSSPSPAHPVAASTAWVAWYFVSYFWLVSSVLMDLLVSMVMECFTRRVPRNEQAEAFWLEGMQPGTSLKVTRKRRWSRELVKADLSELDKGEMIAAAREALVVKLQHMHDRNSPALHTRLRTASVAHGAVPSALPETSINTAL